MTSSEGFLRKNILWEFSEFHYLSVHLAQVERLPPLPEVSLQGGVLVDQPRLVLGRPDPDSHVAVEGRWPAVPLDHPDERAVRRLDEVPDHGVGLGHPRRRDLEGPDSK